MKRLLIISALALVFAVTVACAADGGKIYKSEYAGCHGMQGETHSTDRPH